MTGPSESEGIVSFQIASLNSSGSSGKQVKTGASMMAAGDVGQKSMGAFEKRE
jgi:hypothetical protein